MANGAGPSDGHGGVPSNNEKDNNAHERPPIGAVRGQVLRRWCRRSSSALGTGRVHPSDARNLINPTPTTSADAQAVVDEANVGATPRAADAANVRGMAIAAAPRDPSVAQAGGRIGAHNAGVVPAGVVGAQNAVIVGAHNGGVVPAGVVGAHNAVVVGAHNAGVVPAGAVGAHSTGIVGAHNGGVVLVGAHNAVIVGAQNAGVAPAGVVGAHNGGVVPAGVIGARNAVIVGAHNAVIVGAQNAGAAPAGVVGAHNAVVVGAQNAGAAPAGVVGAHNAVIVGAQNAGAVPAGVVGAHNAGAVPAGQAPPQLNLGGGAVMPVAPPAPALAQPYFNIEAGLLGPPLRRSEVGPFF